MQSKSPTDSGGNKKVKIKLLAAEIRRTKKRLAAKGDWGLRDILKHEEAATLTVRIDEMKTECANVCDEDALQEQFQGIER